MGAYTGQPTYNPALPYIGGLPCPIQDGFMIVIQGTVPQQCNRFHFNLSMGPYTNEKGDSALHCNPRFEGNKQIVLNSFTNGSWGPEQNHKPSPFVKGQQFECILLVTNQEYKIAVNGVHCCQFPHRIAKERVTHLVIEGSVSISCVRYQGTGATPSAAFPQPGYNPPYNPGYPQPGAVNYPMGQIPPAGPPPPYPGHQAGQVPPYGSAGQPCPQPMPPGNAQPGGAGYAQPSPGYPQPGGAGYPQPGGAGYPQPGGAGYPQPGGAGYPQPGGTGYAPAGAAPYGASGGYLNVPYRTMMPPMQPGKKIHVVGMVNHANAKRFAINLRCGDGPNSDIALHFNPRCDEGTVVRNTQRNNRWEKEERTIPHFPFTPGSNFEITIICGPHAYRVHVNHQEYIRYPHRVKMLQRVQNLEITGDLTLHNVRLE